MKTIYKSEKGKSDVLSLYDRQLEKLQTQYKDILLDTSFGHTHVIETGNFNGVPLLVFHGGNATTAYNLLACNFLLNDFHIYAVDTIGHPGKAQRFLSRHITMITESGQVRLFQLLDMIKWHALQVLMVQGF